MNSQGWASPTFPSSSTLSTEHTQGPTRGRRSLALSLVGTGSLEAGACPKTQSTRRWQRPLLRQRGTSRKQSQAQGGGKRRGCVLIDPNTDLKGLWLSLQTHGC